MLTPGNMYFGPQGPIFSETEPQLTARFQVATTIRRYEWTGTPIALWWCTERLKGTVMEFRWIAILTLWTILVGPMVDAPLGQPKARSQPAKMMRAR